MKIGLNIKKRGAVLYSGVHEIIDEETFAAAFGDVWREVRRRRIEATTSVGELMEILSEEVIDELNGAEISLTRTA